MPARRCGSGPLPAPVRRSPRFPEVGLAAALAQLKNKSTLVLRGGVVWVPPWLIYARPFHPLPLRESGINHHESLQHKRLVQNTKHVLGVNRHHRAPVMSRHRSVQALAAFLPPAGTVWMDECKYKYSLNHPGLTAQITDRPLGSLRANF